MYDIAAQVGDWLDAGRPVTLARVVEIRGISSRERSHVLARTPGEPPAGAVLSGSVDGQLLGLLTESSDHRLADVAVDDASAARAGLSCGGSARVLIQPAAEIPRWVWTRLAEREPICLVTEPGGETQAFEPSTIAAAEREFPGVARLFARGATQTGWLAGAVVTVLWPVPTLLVVGDGLIADALLAQAALLGWTSATAAGADERIDALSTADGIVLLSHDVGVAGPVLRAALAGPVGYVGALGSRHTQAARARWLAEHGIHDLTRIHGPAGLAIGAYTPAEIALAIVAEMQAVRTGTDARSLREQPGAIHPDGPNAPPPRY